MLFSLFDDVVHNVCDATTDGGPQQVNQSNQDWCYWPGNAYENRRALVVGTAPITIQAAVPLPKVLVPQTADDPTDEDVDQDARDDDEC
jgi:hypothetical protein